MKTAIRLVEKGFVPKALLRHGIRRLLRDRLREQEQRFSPEAGNALEDWVRSMRAAPVAPVPEKANEQHYELPPAFFQLTLGPRMKYSSAFYADARTTLEDAEVAMLSLTCSRARLRDGQRVLELGCGWGSLTLWMAERYPRSEIVAISNSSAQREHILERARSLGLRNVTVLTRDMNELDPAELDGLFDRVVSVEMFEHMRNWEELMRRVAACLAAEGLFFMHVFAHERYAYPFDVKDESDWMSRYFFTGGMMPSHELVDSLDVPFETEERWNVSGEHYARTAEDWLHNLESNRTRALEILAGTYGARDAERWFQRWRVFFLACAELFAYRGGKEWIVSHHLLRPTCDAAALRRTGS